MITPTYIRTLSHAPAPSLLPPGVRTIRPCQRDKDYKQGRRERRRRRGGKGRSRTNVAVKTTHQTSHRPITTTTIIVIIIIIIIIINNTIDRIFFFPTREANKANSLRKEA